MYFWNVRSLKEQLLRGVTPRESLQYVLALSLAPVLLDFVVNLFGTGLYAFLKDQAETPSESLQRGIRAATENAQQWEAWGALASATHAAALAIGLYFCYRRNGAAVGMDLLSRLVALAWVSTIRVSVLVLLPLELTVAVVRVATSALITEQAWTWMGLPTFSAAVILGLTGKHMGDVARRSAQPAHSAV